MKKEASRVKWYVMRAYKSEKRAEEVLGGEGGLEFFIPKQYAVRVFHGVKSKRLVPAIPSIVFVHASKDEILEFKKSYNFLQFVIWEKSTGAECITVPDSQMEDFIKVSSCNLESTVYFRPDEVDMKNGTRVLIHGGRFDGVTGMFLKVNGKRNRRLVVLLDGIMAVAAEIDPDLIEIL